MIYLAWAAHKLSINIADSLGYGCIIEMTDYVKSLAVGQQAQRGTTFFPWFDN